MLYYLLLVEVYCRGNRRERLNESAPKLLHREYSILYNVYYDYVYSTMTPRLNGRSSAESVALHLSILP